MTVGQVGHGGEGVPGLERGLQLRLRQPAGHEGEAQAGLGRRVRPDANGIQRLPGGRAAMEASGRAQAVHVRDELGRQRPAVVQQSGPPDASRPPGHGEVHRRVGLELARRRVAPPPGSRGHRQAVQVGRRLVGEDGIRASAQERGEVIGGEAVPGLGQAQVGPARARTCPLPVDALPDPLQVRPAGAVGRQPQSGQVRGQQDGGLVGRQRNDDARHAPIGRRRRGARGALAAARG